MGATEASSLPLPATLISRVSAQVLATLAATAVALPANADVQSGQPMQVPQMEQAPQMQQTVTGRATYSRFLEFVEEGVVQRVDFFDFGRTAIVKVQLGGRDQQVSVDTPGASSGLIEKLQAKNVAIEVHTPEKPNPLLNVVADVAIPLLVIGGL